MNISSTEGQVPTGILYHYTSQTGLLGIIQKRQVWATNMLFLNDSLELNYALLLIKNVVKNMKSSLTPKEVRFLENMEEDFENVNTHLHQSFDGIYVCSFSEEGNQLSQWRGYCPDTGGFSLGFDFNPSLLKIISDQGFRLAKCIYEYEVQKKLVIEYVKDVLSIFNKETDFMEISSKAWDGFFSLAPLVKHPKFSEEKEWRLISKPRTIFGAHFRTGKSMLIPYVTIDLLKEKEEGLNIEKTLTCIPEVIIGPTPNPELSSISLENFLRVERVFPRVDDDGRPKTKCLVLDSEIPYRTW